LVLDGITAKLDPDVSLSSVKATNSSITSSAALPIPVGQTVTLVNTTVNMDVTNDGTLVVGGTVNVPGLTSTGAFDEEIGGTPQGTQYGQVAVAGHVVLAGTLNVFLLNGFMPAPGEVFTIIRNDGSAGVIGMFNGLAEGGLISAGGWQFAISYHGGDGDDVTLTAKTQSTTTSLASSTPTSTYGDGVMFTATVSSQFSGIPGGMVTFYELSSSGSVISKLGTNVLDNHGVATLQVSGLWAMISPPHLPAAIPASPTAAFPVPWD
jgi:hypothetical protein